MHATSTNSTIHNLCISGASISKCPWLTWVDCLVESLRPFTVTNHSCKGAGNQFIISSAFHAVNDSDNNKFLAIMLTNFDKYDMWVEDNACQELHGEKHPPHWINGQVAKHEGFWCTGSHFPLKKEIYQKNFFNLGLTASQNLIQTLGLVKYCQDKNIPFIMMFDSPILKYTESQINDFCKHQKILHAHSLEQNPLVAPAWSVLQSYMLDVQGLIGFCMEHDLPWTSELYGPHPPSISHLKYFQQTVVPWIYKRYPHIELRDLDADFLKMADRMTIKWQKKEF
jgi:hypothetical protein